jgi:diguanylate cyclase (GGDEF)-like protein
MNAARWRSSASLVLVLALVAGGGLLGVLTARAATARSVEVHRQDRDAFRAAVGKLVYGYFGSAFKTLDDTAKRAGFTLAPGDPGDLRRLRQLVDGSVVFGEGAVLTDLTGAPLTSHMPNGLLPPVTDPGYTPLIQSLTRREPGMSAVMSTPRGHLVTAFAVPVTKAGTNAGLLIGFMRMDGEGPSKQFLTQLPLSERTRLYTIDSRGVIASSNHLEDLGRPAPTLAAQAAAFAGGSGLKDDERGGVAYVDAYAPIGFGGWTIVIDEPSADFLGPIQRGGTEVQVALIVLLVIAAAVVSVLHHRRQLALQQLADQALRDPLTGLPNRILFQSRLDASMTPGSMPPGGVALLFCDLDGFKQVNDGYGHAAGDELLIAVGERLRSCVRETDLVARMGGDEFTVLLDGGADTPAETEQRAQEVARRVTERLAQPVEVGLGRPPVRVGVSIGVCVLDPDRLTGADGGGTPDMLRLADDAMYRAKSRKTGPEMATIA